jgi:hypothetical protein
MVLVGILSEADGARRLAGPQDISPDHPITPTLTPQRPPHLNFVS